MIEPVYLVLATVFYTLIGVRIGIVVDRARKNHGLEPQRFTTVLLCVIWPFGAFVVGFMTLMTGDALIFRSLSPSDGANNNEQERQ